MSQMVQDSEVAASSTRSPRATGDIILQTRELSKTYRPMFARSGKVALENLTIDVRQGEIFGACRPQRKRQNHDA